MGPDGFVNLLNLVLNMPPLRFLQCINLCRWLELDIIHTINITNKIHSFTKEMQEENSSKICHQLLVSMTQVVQVT